MLAMKSSITIPLPPAIFCNFRQGYGFIMSIARTTAKKLNIIHHGNSAIGMPISAIGNNIHSSAVMRPSSFTPNIRSATPQMGIANNAKIVHIGSCKYNGKYAIAYASITPGIDPKVPGANGANKPMPNPVAINRQNFFKISTSPRIPLRQYDAKHQG